MPMTSRAGCCASSRRLGATRSSAILPGRVTVTSDDTGGPANVFIHDAHGRLLSLQAGDETRMSFAYDAGGNPVAVSDRRGAVTVQEWDERANLTRRVTPTGAEFGFAYDERDRVLEVSASTGARFRVRLRGCGAQPGRAHRRRGRPDPPERPGRARARHHRPRRRARGVRL